MADRVVGLDIGTSGVRAAEFQTRRGKLVLRRFASVPLARGVVRGGGVADGEALSEALKQLWSAGRFKTRNVVLGIANAGVLVRQMDFDWMPYEDFRKALRYQAEGALPIPVDDANLDYHLLEELEVATEGQEPRKVARVLLVAASREMVDGFLAAAQKAKLRPVQVDLLPFALVRAATPRPDPTSHDVEVLVDIGADTVCMVVHSGGIPKYVRIVPGIGGDSITDALRERYEWSWEDAERTKVYVGLPGHARLEPERLGVGVPPADGLDHPAQRTVETAAQALVDEVVATLDYYRGASAESDAVDDDHAPVTRVLLAGGGSRLAGLAELLGERLGTAVEPLAVLDRIKRPRSLWLGPGDDPALVMPVGLCTAVGR